MLLVRDSMTNEVATLTPRTTAAQALALCREKRIRHLPVLEDGKLVGMVSDRDLRSATPALGDPAAQMDRIARRAREAAATARELASYHEGLSPGAPKSEATTPAPHPAMPMAQVEVVELIVTAKTPAEHRKLGKQFAAEAARYTEDADRHAAMAAGYRANPNRRGGDPAIHCDRFVQQVRDAATAARELANYHERVAAGGQQ